MSDIINWILPNCSGMWKRQFFPPKMAGIKLLSILREQCETFV